MYEELNAEAERILAHYRKMDQAADFLKRLVEAKCSGRFERSPDSPYPDSAIALEIYKAWYQFKWKPEQGRPKSYQDIADAARHLKNDSIRDRLLARYYGNGGPGENASRRLGLIDGPDRFEPIWMPALDVDAPSEPETDDDATGTEQPNSTLTPLRRKFHRYHLTLDKSGNPVWLYTVLDFSDSNQNPPGAKRLRTRAPILLEAGCSHEDNMYEWHAYLRGDHLVIQVQHHAASSDIGVEIYPSAKRRSEFYGVRVNETWRETDGPKMADSIAILSRDRPLKDFQGLPIGPVEPSRYGELEDIWNSAGSKLFARLPDPTLVLTSEVSNQPENSSVAIAESWTDSALADLIRAAKPGTEVKLLTTFFVDEDKIFPLISRQLNKGVSFRILLTNPDNVGLVRARFSMRFSDGKLPEVAQQDIRAQFVTLSGYKHRANELRRKHQASSPTPGLLDVRFSDRMPVGFFVQSAGKALLGLMTVSVSYQHGPQITALPGSALWTFLEENFEECWEHHRDSEQHLAIAIPEPLRNFWKRYLQNEFDGKGQVRRRLVVYGRPTFNRNSERTVFTRTVGEEAGAILDKLMGEGREVVSRPSHTFINAGEVRGMLVLSEWFSRCGVTLESRGSMKQSEEDRPNFHYLSEEYAHGIILGSPEDNAMVINYQNDPEFVFQADFNGISWIATDLEKRHRFTNEMSEAYVLVSRGPGAHDPESIVTVISSRVARAIKFVCDELTNSDRMARISELAGIAGEWPDKFQLVFKVRLMEEIDPGSHRWKETEIASGAELFDCWPRGRLKPKWDRRPLSDAAL